MRLKGGEGARLHSDSSDRFRFMAEAGGVCGALEQRDLSELFTEVAVVPDFVNLYPSMMDLRIFIPTP